MALASKEGQRIPQVSFPVREGDAWKTITTDDLFAGKTVVRVDFTDVLRPETRTEDTSRFTLKQQAQQQVASLVLDDRDLQKLSEWDYL